MPEPLLQLHLRLSRIVDQTKQLQRSVRRRMDRVLRDWAAYTYRRARSRMRKRKGPAPPGSYPSSHTGALKRLLRFARIDEASYRVGILPTRSNTGAPAALEWGGRTQLLTRERAGRRRKVVVTIRPRPYLVPSRDQVRRQSLPGLIVKHSRSL